MFNIDFQNHCRARKLNSAIISGDGPDSLVLNLFQIFWQSITARQEKDMEAYDRFQSDHNKILGKTERERTGTLTSEEAAEEVCTYSVAIMFCNLNLLVILSSRTKN